MTFAQPRRRNAEQNQAPDFPLFVLAAMALVAVQIGWAVHLDGGSEDTLRAAAGQRPDFYWANGVGSLAAAVLLTIVGGKIVALLFSYPKVIQPRHAWVGFAIWALTMTGANLWSSTWPVGGYADRTGVAWYNRHGPIDRQAWSAATGIAIGCNKGKKSRWYFLRYEVAFSDRKAPLANRASAEGASAWLGKVIAVNAAIPADARFTRLSFDWRCIAYHSGELSLEEDKALVALFRPTPERARRIEKQSPVWGQFIGQVAAEEAAKARR